MPPQRTVPPIKAIKTERTHEENQERAYIAASRRNDRSLEARLESARRASEIHKRRTGRSLRVTEQDVVNEEMYEEEDLDLPWQYRRLAAHLQTNSPDFNGRLTAYLTNQIAVRSAIDQMVANSYAQHYPNAPQFAHNQTTFPSPLVNPTILPPSSPSTFRSAPYPTPGMPGYRAHHGRSSSAASPRDHSHGQDGHPTQQDHRSERQMSLPTSATPEPGQSTPSNSHPEHHHPLWTDDGSFPFTTSLSAEVQQLLGPALDPSDPLSSRLMEGSEKFIQSPYYPWPSNMEYHHKQQEQDQGQEREQEERQEQKQKQKQPIPKYSSSHIPSWNGGLSATLGRSAFNMSEVLYSPPPPLPQPPPPSSSSSSSTPKQADKTKDKGKDNANPKHFNIDAIINANINNINPSMDSSSQTEEDHHNHDSNGDDDDNNIEQVKMPFSASSSSEMMQFPLDVSLEGICEESVGGEGGREYHLGGLLSPLSSCPDDGLRYMDPSISASLGYGRPPISWPTEMMDDEAGYYSHAPTPRAGMFDNKARYRDGDEVGGGVVGGSGMGIGDAGLWNDFINDHDNDLSDRIQWDK